MVGKCSLVCAISCIVHHKSCVRDDHPTSLTVKVVWLRTIRLRIYPLYIDRVTHGGVGPEAKASDAGNKRRVFRVRSTRSALSHPCPNSHLISIMPLKAPSPLLPASSARDSFVGAASVSQPLRIAQGYILHQFRANARKPALPTDNLNLNSAL